MARPRKCWSLRVGAHGHRVTVYERTPGGPLWLRWWVPGADEAAGRWEYRALRHTDRTAAEELARTVAGQLLASAVGAQAGRATVAEIFTAYERDVAAHLKGQGPREARRRIAIWTHFLGATRDANTIDLPTCERYVRERRAGALRVLKAPATATVEAEYYQLRPNPTDRAIGADFTLLQAALNHATKVVRPNGKRLLEVNPIRGFVAPTNKAPRRPVASYDRYERVFAVADAVDPQRLFGAFMMLVEGLGWRVSAICQLRACDVDRRATPSAPHGRIYKNPAIDKEASGGWLPMSASVRAGIDRALTANPALGEWPLFPAPRARTGATPATAIPKPWARHHARALLERAESAARLEPLDGSDFHAYRRKWATERKHLPAQDVAAAGAWRDLRALQTAYQQTDETTLLAVVSEPTKLRERKPDEDAAAS